MSTPGPEPAEYRWNRSDQRPIFAYVLASWLAGVATVAAFRFYLLPTGLGTAARSAIARAPVGRSFFPVRGVDIGIACGRERNRAALNEQKSPDTASPRTASHQLTLDAVRPLRSDEAAILTVSAKNAGLKAAVVISRLAAGSALSAGTRLRGVAAEVDVARRSAQSSCELRRLPHINNQTRLSVHPPRSHVPPRKASETAGSSIIFGAGPDATTRPVSSRYARSAFLNV
jgi:hypothetical protein